MPRIEDFLSQILSNAKMPGHGQPRLYAIYTIYAIYDIYAICRSKCKSLSNAKMPGHGQQRRLHGQENLHKYMLERNDTVAHSQKSSCALGKLILSKHGPSGLTVREILHAGSDLISSSRV